MMDEIAEGYMVEPFCGLSYLEDDLALEAELAWLHAVHFDR
jgi:hypothetical protein